MMNGATNQKCGAGEQPLDQEYGRHEGARMNTGFITS